MREKEYNLKRCEASLLKVRQRFVGIWEEWAKWKSARDAEKANETREFSLSSGRADEGQKQRCFETKMRKRTNRTKRQQKILFNRSKEEQQQQKNFAMTRCFVRFIRKVARLFRCVLAYQAKCSNETISQHRLFNACLTMVRLVVHFGYFCNKMPMVFFYQILEMMPCHVCVYQTQPFSLFLSLSRFPLWVKRNKTQRVQFKNKRKLFDGERQTESGKGEARRAFERKAKSYRGSEYKLFVYVDCVERNHRCGKHFVK